MILTQGIASQTGADGMQEDGPYHWEACGPCDQPWSCALCDQQWECKVEGGEEESEHRKRPEPEPALQELRIKGAAFPAFAVCWGLVAGAWGDVLGPLSSHLDGSGSSVKVTGVHMIKRERSPLTSLSLSFTHLRKRENNTCLAGSL